jgi:protein-L-isoaspartate O-methyltransferase
VTRPQTESQAIRYQADEHPLVPTQSFASIESYVLYLIHLAAYECAASMAKDKTVIEVGCNTGYGTAIVSRGARAVAGVDVSPRCIEEAGYAGTTGARSLGARPLLNRRLLL